MKVSVVEFQKHHSLSKLLQSLDKKMGPGRELLGDSFPQLSLVWYDLVYLPAGYDREEKGDGRGGPGLYP